MSLNLALNYLWCDKNPHGTFVRAHQRRFSVNVCAGIVEEGGAGGDFRPVIHYRDLDAPREPEEFI